MMKSAIIYPYGPFRGNGCCRILHAKHLAFTSAIYSLVSLFFTWFYKLYATLCHETCSEECMFMIFTLF